MTANSGGQYLEFSSYLFPQIRGAVNITPEDSVNKPINFQFLPKIDTDGMSASYGGIQDTLGRAEGMNIYKNSSNRGITISTSFVADGKQTQKSGDSGRIRDEAWVQHQVNRLMALTKPFYDRTRINKGQYFAPPYVLFTHGLRFVNCPVIIESVTPTTPEESMIEGITTLPQIVNVSIQMKTNYPYGFVPGYLNIFQTFSNTNINRDPSNSVVRNYENYQSGTANQTWDGTVKDVLTNG